MVAGHLADLPAPCRDAAVWIASELASNAVHHAATPYVVELLVGETVRIEVTDLAPVAAFLRVVPAEPERGHGLLLVSELAARWGVDWRDDFKVVWAEVPRDAPVE